MVVSRSVSSGKQAWGEVGWGLDVKSLPQGHLVS